MFKLYNLQIFVTADKLCKSIPDPQNFLMAELKADFVADKSCTDRYDGFQHIEIVFTQGISGFHDINDDIGKLQNRSDFDGAVQMDNVNVPAFFS